MDYKLSNQQITEIEEMMNNEQHDIPLFLLFQDLCLKIAESTACVIENESISQ